MSYDIFITYEMMYDDIMTCLMPKIPRDIVAVFGVPRSGLIPASMVSSEFNIPMGVVGCDTLFGGNRIGEINSQLKEKILVVDDSVGSGRTFKKHKNDIDNLMCRYNVVKSCVYMSHGNEDVVSIFAKRIKSPRIFEWNLFNSYKISDMIFDMDGVLCQDSNVFDDDGIEYQNSLIQAVPLHIPRYPIKAICTSRLEKWRDITEDWLKRFGVKYGSLVMCPFKTAKERRENGNKAKYKANTYVNLNGSLFVESSVIQAKNIAKFSNRNVLSLDDKKVYMP